MKHTKKKKPVKTIHESSQKKETMTKAEKKFQAEIDDFARGFEKLKHTEPKKPKANSQKPTPKKKPVKVTIGKKSVKITPVTTKKATNG